MIRQKVFPAHDGYGIHVTIEQMGDGLWSAVATVTHSTKTSERAIDLPVHAARFESEEAAERFAVGMAQDWIEENVPTTS